MNYIINFVDTCSSQDTQNYLESNNLTVVKVFNNFEKIYLVEASQTPPKTGIIEDIVQDSNNPIQLLQTVEFPITESSVLIEVDNDKNWWKAASFYDLDWQEAEHKHYLLGKDVDVYIVDSGIDQTHPEFQDVNISLLYTFNGNYTDVNGHGTAIASLISGKTCGLTAANLKILKIFESGLPTLISQIVEAFNTIINDLPNSKAAIVNLSWSIPRNEFVDKIIKNLIYRNVLVVAAAGNNGSAIGDVTPAALEEVITIGSYSQNFEPSNFSNYTDPSAVSFTSAVTNTGALDGWAPGEKIWVATPGGGYNWAAGTSMSAAIHSGALAYDIDFSAINQGSLISYFNQDWFILRAMQSLSRNNILTLSQQYSNSVNKITTYIGKNSPFFPTKEFYNVTFAWVSGVQVPQPFINRINVKSVTIDPPLPSYLTLLPSGQLLNVGELAEADPDYKLTSHTAEITFEDDTTYSIQFEASIRKEDLDISTLPDGYVWVQAQGILCGGIPTCPARCPNGNPNALPWICGPVAKVDPICESCEFR